MCIRDSFDGEGALATLNHLMANDLTTMVDGQVRYSPMLNEQGGIVDDLVAVSYTHLDVYKRQLIKPA